MHLKSHHTKYKTVAAVKRINHRNDATIDFLCPFAKITIVRVTKRIGPISDRIRAKGHDPEE